MKTTCYLQVEPEFASWNADRLRSITVRRVTQKYPRDPLPGCVVLQIALDIADAAFLPLKPKVEIVIPVEHVGVVEIQSEPVEVPA